MTPGARREDNEDKDKDKKEEREDNETEEDEKGSAAKQAPRRSLPRERLTTTTAKTRKRPIVVQNHFGEI